MKILTSQALGPRIKQLQAMSKVEHQSGALLVVFPGRGFTSWTGYQLDSVRDHVIGRKAVVSVKVVEAERQSQQS